jgi:hypothetical protein
MYRSPNSPARRAGKTRGGESCCTPRTQSASHAWRRWRRRASRSNISPPGGPSQGGATPGSGGCARGAPSLSRHRLELDPRRAAQPGHAEPQGGSTCARSVAEGHMASGCRGSAAAGHCGGAGRARGGRPPPRAQRPRGAAPRYGRSSLLTRPLLFPRAVRSVVLAPKLIHPKRQIRSLWRVGVKCPPVRKWTGGSCPKLA